MQVKHARNLCNVGHNQPPNPYVKCYIRHVQCLPGTNIPINRYNKRKTRVIQGATNPTYNEIVSYLFTFNSNKNDLLTAILYDNARRFLFMAIRSDSLAL